MKFSGKPMVAFCIFLLNFITEVQSTNPGARIRLSQKGLNYGANVAVDILTDSVTKIKIPDERGNAPFAGGKVEYEVTNIKITNFQKPGTSVNLNAGKGLTWSLANLNVNVKGDWHYKYRKAFIKISDHGSFDGSVSGVTGTVSVTLGQNPSTGGLTIASTGCLIQISDLHIKIHGGASWFYNLFRSLIEKPIRNNLEKLLCQEARKAIDVDAARELATLPVTVVLGRDWLLDYRLVAPPAFTDSFLQSFHKGEFFHVNDRAEAPFQPDSLPDSAPYDRMATIWLSDYMLTTAGYALYKRGIMNHTLTAKDLPPEFRGYLDTTCRTSIFCFGSFLPEVRKLYPNSSVEIEMATSEFPKCLISPTGVEGRLVGPIIHRARLSNGTLAYLFTARASVIVSIVPRLDANIIKGKVEKLTPAINVTDSAVGPVSSAALTGIFNIMSKNYVVPKLNEVGERGFPLPAIKHVKYVNANLTSQAHALTLTTDVQYSKYF